MTSLPPQCVLWLMLLAFAASSDVAVRRIPNRVVVLVAAAGVLVAWGRGGARDTALAMLAGVGTGAVLMLAWRKGGLGGADVKLAAAATVGVGVDRLPSFMLAAAIAGGAVSAAVLAHAAVTSRARVAAGAHAPALGAGRVMSVPYGVAIAAGAAYAVL